MKNRGYIYLVFSLLLVFTSSIYTYAQNRTKKKDYRVIEGDKLFGLEQYVKAAELYKKAYEENPNNHEALFKLAESYRMQFDYLSAQKYYQIATKVAIKEYPLSRYFYGVMLKDNGNYLEAAEQFRIFREEYKKAGLEAELYKEKAAEEAKGCEMALRELKKPQRNYVFKQLPTPINSTEHDFAPVIMENDTVLSIASARFESKGKREAGVGGSLTDIYRFKKVSEDDWAAINSPDGFHIVNSPFGESAGSYSPDKSKYYFTRCDEKVKDGDLISYNCAIYVVKFENGKWGKPVKLNDNINKRGQWNAQPSISNNGQVLFFVSRRPGGMGMHDIWYSTNAGDAEDWSPAINMGDKINSVFSEVSPKYYSEERTLFFSSNGRGGFGGLDIYFVHEDNLDSVKNAGLPFNSNRDDQDLILGKKHGYLSSNRNGGMGGFDIYTFAIESKESLIAYINNDTAKAKELHSISVVGTLTNAETKEPAKDVPVVLADESSKELKNTTTNDSGQFRFENLSTEQNYKVLLVEKDAKITKEVSYIVEDVQVKGSDKAVSRVLFDNIYFDFDKHELKTEAKLILEKIFKFYKQHPEIQIELSAYTDNLGSVDYNKALAKLRGEEAMKFLVSKGVDKSALVVNAQGETNPAASNNTDLGRQLNRRIEFFIIGGAGYQATLTSATINPNERALYYVAKQFNMSVEDLEKYLKHEKLDIAIENKEITAAPSDLKYTYYSVQPKNTLFSIARLYGMNVDELMSLNNISTSNPVVKVGQRLKIKVSTEVSPNQHQVKQGETLASIASKYELTVDELVRLNTMEGYLLDKYMLLKVK